MMADASMKDASPSWKQIKSFFSIDTEMAPCCLDFCPVAPEFFAVGTYKLIETPEAATETEKQVQDEEREAHTQDQSNEETTPVEAIPKTSQKRVGCLYLFSIQNRDREIGFKTEQTIPFDSGILDLGFSNITPKMLALGTSIGHIHLYTLNAFGGQLNPHSIIPAFKSETLILSLSWGYACTTSHGDAKRQRDCLATSDSTGAITLHYFRRSDYKYRQKDPLPPEKSGHSDQAWTASWTVDLSRPDFHTPILLTGGDDAKLNRHNFLRCIYQSGEGFSKHDGTESDFRTHGAGVTSIMAFPVYPGEKRMLLLTGSYDDHVRIYNLSEPNMRRRVLAELNLGGGVWKLRLLRDITVEAKRKIDQLNAPKSDSGAKPDAGGSPNPSSVSDKLAKTSLGGERLPLKEDVPLHFQVIASCMYEGIRVLDVRRDEEENWRVEMVGKFEEGKSMAYAGAAAPIFDKEGQRPNGKTLCVSTSFYDNKVFIWWWK